MNRPFPVGGTSTKKGHNQIIFFRLLFLRFDHEAWGKNGSKIKWKIGGKENKNSLFFSFYCGDGEENEVKKGDTLEIA